MVVSTFAFGATRRDTKAGDSYYMLVRDPPSLLPATFLTQLLLFRQTRQVVHNFSVSALYDYYDTLPSCEAAERLLQAAEEEKAAQMSEARGDVVRGDVGVERVLLTPPNRLNVNVPELLMDVDSPRVRSYAMHPPPPPKYYVYMDLCLGALRGTIYGQHGSFR